MVFVSARLTAAVVASVVFGLAGCGDDESSAGVQDTSQQPRSNDATACELLQRVEQLDDQSQAILNEALGPLLGAPDASSAEAVFDDFLAAYQPFVSNELPTILATYEELGDAVPVELRADVEVLRDFTEQLATGLASAQTPQAVQELFTSDPERTQDAVNATLRLDEYSRDACDVVIAD